MHSRLQSEDGQSPITYDIPGNPIKQHEEEHGTFVEWHDDGTGFPKRPTSGESHFDNQCCVQIEIHEDKQKMLHIYVVAK